jgi:hypothetical protein
MLVQNELEAQVQTADLQQDGSFKVVDDTEVFRKWQELRRRFRKLLSTKDVWDFDFGTCSVRLAMLKQQKDAPEDFAALFGL